MAETRRPEPASKQETNITDLLPRIIKALQETPYGEVKVIMKAGRVVEILLTSKILVE